MLLKKILFSENIVSSLNNLIKIIQMYAVKSDQSYRDCIQILTEIYVNADHITKFLKKCKRKEIHYNVNNIQVHFNNIKILIKQFYMKCSKIKIDNPQKQIIQQILVEINKKIDLLHRHILLQKDMS